ncbi:MAG TPA: putative 2OG-Fe(II) oxygenase [Allosphingosinicella sp.]|nr:putative 2OG-Fe(II) oxygenase [Allosphingosinicella sp.]
MSGGEKSSDEPPGLRGARLEGQRRLDEAALAYEAALASDPESESAVDGRARVALLRKEPEAVEHCRRAVALRNRDPELQLQMILSVAVELGADAIPLLHDFVLRHPEATSAQERLAEMRAEAGEGEAFADAYVAALRRHPRNKGLRLSYCMSLARAGHPERALQSAEAARALLGDDRDFLLLEAFVATHEGLSDRAGALLDRLDDLPDAQLARGQHYLQAGRPAEAKRVLEAAVRANPANLMTWAVLGVAWRVTEDPRHAWLCEQRGLYSIVDLGLSAPQLTGLAQVLRTLHSARFHPVGQSLRGGTQTRGSLLTRPEPEIAALADVIGQAVRRHVANLPPADPGHPLLRHRNSDLSLGGSWSVRLADGGFHVSHVHPGGVISSACYVSLPERLGGDDPKEGWLEVGRPPPELKVDLPPIATVEPRPGRLVLFPSYVFHGTRPFRAGERLSVAFDVVAGS